MDKIKSRRDLNNEIKIVLWDDSEDKIQLPKILYFCEKMGEPTFKITIEKVEELIFTDEKGRKWVRAD